MDPKLLNTFQSLESLSKIRQREVFCPIAKVTAINTPLVAADDLMLKTTMTSVGTYDRELSKIIYKHTIFPEAESQGSKISFDQFTDYLSYLDRLVLLWGIFDSTYGSLGKREIQCPFCKKTFEDDIKSGELLQPDSLTSWDHEQSFKDYEFIINVPIEIDEINHIKFITQLPSIKQHFAVINLLSDEVIQENYKQFGTIFSKVEELTNICHEIRIYKTETEEEPKIINNIHDIYFITNKFLLLSIVTDVLKQFNDHFAKYIPSFKKHYVCGECGKDFDFHVDMEISLFRRFLESD